MAGDSIARENRNIQRNYKSLRSIITKIVSSTLRLEWESNSPF
jgi:hypothetical protein